MSLFADKSKTIVVHHDKWPADQKVYIKAEMDYAAKRAIDAAMLSIRADKSGEVDAKAEMAAMTMETLRQMIVSWTLTDDAGQPVPVSVESIDALKAPVADYIYDEIERHNKHNKAMSADDAADFGGGSGAASNAADPPPTNSSTSA